MSPSQCRRRPSAMRALPLAALLLAALMACGEKERDYVANITDGDAFPTMTTTDVETFISDSGYTRYHISTPLWSMYDDAAEPFWRFPDGLDLQQYDLQFNPDAHMECDSAVYFSRKKLWRLDGHVMMVNTLRDTFLSQQLFWDQTQRSVYTDSFIHIVRSDRIIEGYGFQSNENMTAYTVNRPTAILPMPQRGEAATPTDSLAPGTPDSISSAPSLSAPPVDRRRQARHKSLSPDGLHSVDEAPQSAPSPGPGAKKRPMTLREARKLNK